MKALICGLVGLLLAGTAHARIVTIGGAVTEIVFALGAGDRVVATDSTSTYPEAANKLPRIGYMRSVAAEGVLAQRPAVVIATADAGPPAAMAQLRAAGARVVVASGERSIEGVRRNVRLIADALGVPTQGAALEQRLMSEWRAVTEALRGHGSTPRVLFLLGHSGRGVLMAAGEGTAAAAMIALAGGRNAFGATQGYKLLNAEGAIGARPDVIVITTEGLAAHGGTHAVLAQHGLAATPAGRSQRLAAIDALLLLGFGPRLPAAVGELARAIHAR
jgi:iron complex transport system substrate-binding protein